MITGKRWTHFSLDGVKFPTCTIGVVKRGGEALVTFERDLIIHLQQISKATLLCARALLGGVRRTLEEQWHYHAEGVLVVALRTLSIPPEAWQSAKLLRVISNCRLV